MDGARASIGAATRQAAALFAVCGAMGLLAAVAPGTPSPTGAVAVGLVDLALAGLLLVLPWHRRPAAAPAVVVTSACTAIGLSSAVGLVPVRSYGVLYVLVFAWLGAHFPPRTALPYLPVVVPAYVLPLALVDLGPPLDWRAVALCMVTCVLVAETIARNRQRVLLERTRADGAAAAFRAVAHTSAALQRLDPGEVLDVVTSGVLALGYDGAFLALAEDAPGAQRHVQGTVVAGARESRVPIVVDGEEVGVLVACHASEHVDEVQPLEALAAVAGAALGNVEQFEREKERAQEHSRAAMTDALTGLPNRRAAELALERVHAGDVVALIDLDHFGDVNERLGHAGGDAVLEAIGSHLMAALREEDVVARYGGEEFLLLLGHRTPEAAASILRRVARSWRATNPATTFSAGLAQHHGGDVTDALVRADVALYEAKRTGRDRCVTYTSELAAPMH